MAVNLHGGAVKVKGAESAGWLTTQQQWRSDARLKAAVVGCTVSSGLDVTEAELKVSSELRVSGRQPAQIIPLRSFLSLISSRAPWTCCHAVRDR